MNAEFINEDGLILIMTYHHDDENVEIQNLEDEDEIAHFEIPIDDLRLAIRKLCAK
jgi:hypothetical protein